MAIPSRSPSRPAPSAVLVGGAVLGTALSVLVAWLLGGRSGFGLLPGTAIALPAGTAVGALVLARFRRRGTLARRPTEFAGIGVLAACAAVVVVAVVGGALHGDLRAVPLLLSMTLLNGQLVVLVVTHLVMAALLRPAGVA